MDTWNKGHSSSKSLSIQTVPGQITKMNFIGLIPLVRVVCLVLTPLIILNISTAAQGRSRMRAPPQFTTFWLRVLLLTINFFILPTLSLFLQSSINVKSWKYSVALNCFIKENNFIQIVFFLNTWTYERYSMFIQHLLTK